MALVKGETFLARFKQKTFPQFKQELLHFVNYGVFEP